MYPSLASTEQNELREQTSSDQVRTTNEADVTTQTNLTTYHEEESLTVTEVDGYNASDALWRLAEQMPPQNLGTILSRSYEVDSFQWEGTDVIGTNLSRLNFPKVLFDIPQIAKELPYFKFFRCKGIRFGIRLNSTSFHSGRLLISNVPGSYIGALDRNPQNGEYKQRLNNKPHLVSAMTAGVVEIDYDWEIPNNWFKLPLQAAEVGLLNRVCVDVMVPLQTVSDATVPIGVTLFASFLEPEVTGPSPDDAITASLAIEQSSERKHNGKEQEEKTETHSMLSDFSDMITGVVEPITNIVATLAPLAALLDKPTTLDVSTKMRPEYASSMTYGDGADDVVKFSLKTDAGISVEQGVGGSLSPSLPFSEAVGRPGHLRQFSFDSNAVPGVIIDSWPVAPMLCEGQGDAPPNKIYPTYLAWYSSAFGLWRGSLNYTFVFTASKFVSTRVRISFAPLATTPFALGTYTGDIASKVIDITGDTEFSIAVPFVSDKYYESMTAINQEPVTNTGLVQVELLNNVVLSSNTAAAQTIYCNVWISAGADYQVSLMDGQYINNGNQVNVDQTTVVQSSVMDIAAGAEKLVEFSAAIEDRYIAADHPDCVTTMMKRYTRMLDSVVNSAILGNIYPADFFSTPGDTFKSIKWLTAPNRFYRGSIRYRVYYNDAFAGIKNAHLQYGSSSSYTLDSMYNAGVLHQAGKESMMAFEIPYYDKFRLRSIENNADITSPLNNITPYYVYLPTTSTSNCQSYVAVGDDFTLASLYAPPVLGITANPISSSEEEGDESQKQVSKKVSQRPPTPESQKK